LIPAKSAPKGLVHAIERHNLDGLPGDKTVYAHRDQLEAGLTVLLAGIQCVAMEYSPGCAIPYLSRVDAGTAEAVRSRGVQIVSSGDLVQLFDARWSARQLISHQQASASLYRIKDRAFDAIRQAIADHAVVSEYDIQQQMSGWFQDEGLVSDSAPVVAVAENGGNPHYIPTAARTRVIHASEVVVLDLWGKRTEPHAVFADITWVGFSGRDIPKPVSAAFDAVVRARDIAIALVQSAAEDGRDLHGWEVDRSARTALEKAGFGDHILHRTGHNLGEEVHGNGAHLDDFETHDDRLILPGTGFTVEPGLYFTDFGVRTEIDMFRSERDALVTGPCQTEVTVLA
jgi:Xaa-Pro aminopeptidase